jgi:hypothetical protein
MWRETDSGSTAVLAGGCVLPQAFGPRWRILSRSTQGARVRARRASSQGEALLHAFAPLPAQQIVTSREAANRAVRRADGRPVTHSRADHRSPTSHRVGYQCWFGERKPTSFFCICVRLRTDAQMLGTVASVEVASAAGLVLSFAPFRLDTVLVRPRLRWHACCLALRKCTRLARSRLLLVFCARNVNRGLVNSLIGPPPPSSYTVVWNIYYRIVSACLSDTCMVRYAEICSGCTSFRNHTAK